MKSNAPWNQEQVINLYYRQGNKNLHPYTCNCGKMLIPMMNGWFCIDCEKIVQKWAYQSDTEYLKNA